jgi:hypothetical protein
MVTKTKETAKKPAVKKAPAKSTKAETKTTTKAPAKPAAKAKGPTKLAVPKKTTTKAAKTIYHVSKRDNDGREWKVFIQESKKVIKLFDTQAEALEYAKQLAENNNGTVILHGLNGKIRKV